MVIYHAIRILEFKIENLNIMKKQLKYLVILLFALLQNNCSKEPESVEEYDDPFYIKFTNEEVMAVAEEALPENLKIIPTTSLQDFGFNSRDEFEQIVMKTPYLLLATTLAFRDDTSFVHIGKYLFNYNEWWVPLTIDGDIRCFLHMWAPDDSIIASGIGRSEIAEGVTDCEKTHHIQDVENKYIIAYNASAYDKCRFIIWKPDSTMKIYSIYEPRYDCIDTATVYECFEDFFYSKPI